MLPAGRLRQRENVLLRSGRDHHGCRCLRRCGGLAFDVSSRPVSRREIVVSKLVRMVAAGSAMASHLLGAAAVEGIVRAFRDRKARWQAWIYC